MSSPTTRKIKISDKVLFVIISDDLYDRDLNFVTNVDFYLFVMDFVTNTFPI